MSTAPPTPAPLRYFQKLEDALEPGEETRALDQKKPDPGGAASLSFTHIEDRAFERLVYRLKHAELSPGGDRVFLMQGVGENGRDIVVYTTTGKVKQIVQCKNYQSRLNAPELRREIIKLALNNHIDSSILDDGEVAYELWCPRGLSGPAGKLFRRWPRGWDAAAVAGDAARVIAKYAAFKGVKWAASGDGVMAGIARLKPVLCDGEIISPRLRNKLSIYEDFFVAKIVMERDAAREDIRAETREGIRLAAEDSAAQAQAQLLAEAQRNKEIRENLLWELAQWGARHIFGKDAEPPLMTLDKMYVEPFVEGENLKSTPVLEALRQLIEKHPVVIVRADFGHGKSLTARALACQMAKEFLSVAKAPASLPRRPVFVKCPEDFLSDDRRAETVIRRALWRLAREIELDLSDDNKAFDPPGPGEPALIILDAFDEVQLSEEHANKFLRHVDSKASRDLRFVLFSRPAALSTIEIPKDIPLLNLQPFTTGAGGQVGAWLDRWSEVTGRTEPLTVEDLEGSDVLVIAKTPILLFMIADTWDDVPAGASRAQMYEAFLTHIARGKHEKDRNENRLIKKASEKLQRSLVKLGYLPPGADTVAAMLWLLGRIAWEVRCRKDAWWLPKTVSALTKEDVSEILRSELDLETKENLHLSLGILLASQANLENDKLTRLFFGHPSFQEFLVGRYWSLTLHRLLQHKDSEWFKRENGGLPLLNGRLLGAEDASFDDFLREMLKVEPWD